MASVHEKYEAKANELAAILAEGKTDKGDVIDLDKITRLSGSKAEKTEEIKRRRTEVEMLGYQVDAVNALKIAEEAKARSQNPTDDSPFGAVMQKEESASEMYIKSSLYKAEGHSFGATTELKVDAKSWLTEFESKTVMTTAAGFATRPARIAELTPIATRPLQVLDVIPSTNTNASAILYMEVTTQTNAAIEIGEGVAYPEAALVLTERTSPVRKIGVILPVTDEQIDDVPQVQALIDETLPFMVRQRLDGQVFNGNGTPPNLTGLLTVSGIQTQAKGADPVPTAFLKAMVKVRTGTGRAVPSGILIHPTDWQIVKTLQDTTGQYIWGNPAVAGPDTMWGLPMVQVDAGSAGTAIVADFRNFVRLYFRDANAGVEVGYVNDDFKLGQKSFRADVRAALVARRPAAICSVTGIV
jgi:HK97 family phage major capsid protein